MKHTITRRAALAALGATPAIAVPVPAERVRQHDESVDSLLKRQNTERGGRWEGGFPDADGLHHGSSGASLYSAFAVAWMLPESRHHQSALLMDRMRLAVDFLRRKSTPDGNLNLLITNYNSPPDTAFAVWGAAQAAFIARQRGAAEIEKLIEPFLKQGGAAMARGGIHTPNHRWVLSSALAQIHALYPDASFLRRIDEWLAEGIDIDSDGQYTERSTVTYNGITNRALTILALKLSRPALLGPVRRNLESMLYLLHPGYQAVTDISRRQDQFSAGGLGNYALSLAWMARRDSNGIYETLSRAFPPGLGDLLEYPQIAEPGPAPAPVPDQYEKHFPVLQVARFRRGDTSATLRLADADRFFAVRRGGAIINAVRFSSAFFGKGQFSPERGEKRGNTWVVEQNLSAPYYQPFVPARRIGTEEWEETRRDRQKTEVCHMRYSAALSESVNGFSLRIQAGGTDEVPVAIEISLGEGELAGCEPAPRVPDGYLLRTGHAEFRNGADRIRFGPGKAEHAYTQVRGAAPKLAGRSVYLTGYTPFDHTIEFRWG